MEVKYRSSQSYGGGIGAVSRKKLTQMRFAAELYAAAHHYSGPMRLAVATVDARYHIALFEVE